MQKKIAKPKFENLNQKVTAPKSLLNFEHPLRKSQVEKFRLGLSFSFHKRMAAI